MRPHDRFGLAAYRGGFSFELSQDSSRFIRIFLQPIITPIGNSVSSRCSSSAIMSNKTTSR